MFFFLKFNNNYTKQPTSIFFILRRRLLLQFFDINKYTILSLQLFFPYYYDFFSIFIIKLKYNIKYLEANNTYNMYVQVHTSIYYREQIILCWQLLIGI